MHEFVELFWAGRKKFVDEFDERGFIFLEDRREAGLGGVKAGALKGSQAGGLAFSLE